MIQTPKAIVLMNFFFLTIEKMAAAMELTQPWQISLLNLLLHHEQSQTWLFNVHSQLLNCAPFLKHLRDHRATDALIFESKIPNGEPLQERLETHKTAGGTGKYLVLTLSPGNKGWLQASSILQSFWKDGLMGIRPQIILILSYKPISVGELEEKNLALINLDCSPNDGVMVPVELRFVNDAFPGRVTKLEKPKTPAELKKERELKKLFATVPKYRC